MENLDIIILTIIVTVLFGLFIFGPMFHAHSLSNAPTKPNDKKTED
jgi:hypothetical protein